MSFPADMVASSEVMRVRYIFLGHGREPEVMSFVREGDPESASLIADMRAKAQAFAIQEGCPVAAEVLWTAPGSKISSALDGLGYYPFRVTVSPE